MKLNEKKLIPYLIVLVPLSLVLMATYMTSSFYLKKVEIYFNSAKERSLNEIISARKESAELYAKQINLLFDYKYLHIEEYAQRELDARIDVAYKTARFIYEKYKKKKSNKNIKERIVDALGHMKYAEHENYVFITDYRANSILLGTQDIDKKSLASYVDADYRSIVLEEIQKVRRYKEGFIKTRDANRGEKEIILVKDLGAFDWFLGTSIKLNTKAKEIKTRLIDMVRSLPVDRSNFILLFDENKNIISAKKEQKKLHDNQLQIIKKNLTKELIWNEKRLHDYYYFTSYYEPLDWYFIYGFKTSTFSEKELQKQKDLAKVLAREYEFISKASIIIIIFVLMLSLLLSLKVRKIFKKYQKEVEKKEEELQELNKSLEIRVQSEIKEHREKEKMLIQRAKMADMGDMLSMIAHQWRQPLNQLSYTLMNIDSAYEYNELTQEYLDEKIKEGNEQLEFMSTTIDDFRNYFKPDNRRELLLVREIIQKSVDLMQKTLEAKAIEIEIKLECNEHHEIYKNEFVQVMLNLIKNAYDVLVDNNIQNPKITILSFCDKKNLTIEVYDNGGGVDEKIIETLFEPYVSTKDTKNATGLGLYMSKMIIEEHHSGILSVLNREKGACFIIKL